MSNSLGAAEVQFYHKNLSQGKSRDYKNRLLRVVI